MHKLASIWEVSTRVIEEHGMVEMVVTVREPPGAEIIICHNTQDFSTCRKAWL